MSEKKLLAIISLLLALIGGILVLANVFRSSNIDLDYLGRRAVDLILGIGAILLGIYMYKGHRNTGGLLVTIVGILILVDQGGIELEGAIVLLGGVLGIVTEGH